MACPLTVAKEALKKAECDIKACRRLAEDSVRALFKEHDLAAKGFHFELNPDLVNWHYLKLNGNVVNSCTTTAILGEAIATQLTSALHTLYGCVELEARVIDAQ